MSNFIAIVVITFVTNITSVPVHENCEQCATDPFHADGRQYMAIPPGPMLAVFTNSYVIPAPPQPRPLRQETTVVLRQRILTGLSFEVDGIQHSLVLQHPLELNSETVSTTVRRTSNKR